MASSSGCYRYDESFEPVANSEEVETYEQGLKEEQEEEEMLSDRFNKKISLKEWCSCGFCNAQHIVKQEECFCCREIDRCVEKLETADDEKIPCITHHPGFNAVCLDEYVLETASIGLRTSKGRSYNVLRRERRTTDAQFFRSVAYRQFFRFVWAFQGVSKRLPLPCCVYNRIRHTFPSEDGTYCGFLEDDDFEEEETHSETDDSTEDL